MDTYHPIHLYGVSVRPPDTSPDTSQPSKPAAADPKPNVEKNQKKWFGVLRVDGVIVDTYSVRYAELCGGYCYVLCLINCLVSLFCLSSL